MLDERCTTTSTLHFSYHVSCQHRRVAMPSLLLSPAALLLLRGVSASDTNVDATTAYPTNLEMAAIPTRVPSTAEPTPHQPQHTISSPTPSLTTASRTLAPSTAEEEPTHVITIASPTQLHTRVAQLRYWQQLYPRPFLLQLLLLPCLPLKDAAMTETGKMTMTAFIPLTYAKVIVIMMMIVLVISFVTNVVVIRPSLDVAEENLMAHYLTTAFGPLMMVVMVVLWMMHPLLHLFHQAYQLFQPYLLLRLPLHLLFQQVRHSYLQ